MASASSDGVLYVSFGSYKQFNQDVMDRVGAAIATLPYKVIWKCNMKVNVELDAKRVMVVEWAPQNDILAHPATRVFLTHGGSVVLAREHAHLLTTMIVCRDEQHP
jgi:UDP:flavonoid glycosyltransferase YjiC (YdhE family)